MTSGFSLGRRVTLRAVRRPALDAAWRAALRDAWHALWVSRLIVLVAGVVAFEAWGLAGDAAGFDLLSSTHGFGTLGDPLAATFARWDATWFMNIARTGFAPDGHRAAFFPLYPYLVKLGHALCGSYIASAVAISGGCFYGALAALRRLTAIELDERAARAAVWVLALWPMSFFFSSMYSESLYLVASVGALYAARRDRWLLAGLLGAVGMATRSTGLLLVIPLALMAWTSWRAGRIKPAEALWIGLIPLALVAWCVGLAVHTDLPATAPFDAQKYWNREFSGPFVGVWDGLVAAWDGARQLLSGSRTPIYFAKAGGDPFWVGRMNLELLGFLLLAVPAVVGTWRRLAPAYGAYVVCALALPLSTPVGPEPLMSLPRFEAVLFPLAMWTGWALTRPATPRWAPPVLGAASVALLCLFTAQFATWHWVA